MRTAVGTAPFAWLVPIAVAHAEHVQQVAFIKMKWVKEDVRIVARVHMFQNRVIQENLPLIVLHVHMEPKLIRRLVTVLADVFIISTAWIVSALVRSVQIME